MMGLLDLEKVISLTGFKSQVLHNLNHHQHIKKKTKKNSVKQVSPESKDNYWFEFVFT